jgi:uncharacterized protein (DUF58 family)
MAERTLIRRAGNVLGRLLLWPIQTLSRVTPDGGLFLALSVVCGVASIGSHDWSNIPLLFSLVLFSLWFMALWHGTRALKRIQFRRFCAERLFANEPLHVSVLLTNTSRLPTAGLTILEELEPEPGPEADSVGAPTAGRQASRGAPARAGTFVTMVAGKEQQRAAYTIMVRRRGIYRFSDTTLETVFPLGFFHTAATRKCANRVVVYPRLGEVDTTFFQELEHSLQFIRRARPSRAEEDFRSLREYREGDNPKWIHWRSTARMQRMLIKEFEEPQAKRVVLLLDTNLQRLGAQRFASFELMLSFAGTVARELLRRGCEVQCVALQPKGKIVRTLVSRERRNLDALLEMLAGIRRDDTRTLGDLREYISRTTLRHAYVLVLGLGSLRTKTNFTWLHGADNAVKVFDARGDEFRQIFRRAGASGSRDEISDEDILLGLGDEDATEEELAATASGTAPAV